MLAALEQNRPASSFCVRNVFKRHGGNIDV